MSNKHETLVNESLENKQLRENLRVAMHTLQKNRKKLIDAQFNDWQGLRKKAANAKKRALNSLDERLVEFEKNATKNGFKVHWAVNGEEACEIIYNLMQEKGADKILKGKSMASEEIHLNKYLEKKGLKPFETDLGEVIIQLKNEGPVHIVVPAIHRNRNEVGQIFHEKIEGAPLENDPEKLNAIARDYMRKEFRKAKFGLCGANFAISKAGCVWQVENEGNNRMSSTLPETLVCICGIEKVVETFEDAVTTNSLLTPSATGQFIANYNNIISGPRQEGELDGPSECHIILLDNNRSNMLAHEDYNEALRCIRCGACLNFCPVYDKISGISYHSVYPGPIGEVISPQLFGLDECGDIVSLCSLCGRCSEVCPVKIPLAELIRKLRRDKVGQGKNPPVGAENVPISMAEKMIFKGFEMAATSGFIFRTATANAMKFNGLIQKQGKRIPVIKNWMKYKDLPNIDFNFQEAIKNTEGVRYE